MERAADVIVIGLGAMGGAAAHHLSARGCNVLGFDQFTPPHVLGSSHGLTRIYRQSYWEDSRYVPMLLRSYDLWRELEEASGESLLHITGGLLIGPEDGELVKLGAQSARQFNLPHEMLGADELKRRYPVFAVQPDTVSLLEQNAGYLNPERCMEAHLREAARHGARLHYDEPVLEWTADEKEGGVTVHTANGVFSAERLVITAGPWAPKILSALAMPLRVTRQVLYWFEPAGSIEAFKEGQLPVYLFERAAGERIVYGFPLTGPVEKGVKVAIHGSDEVCSADTVCREISTSDEQRIRQMLAHTLPSLAGRLLRAETCLYTVTPDENFIIDAHPQHPSVLLAAGFSGHGFKFAPVVGEIIAERILDAPVRYDLGLCSIDRFKTPLIDPVGKNCD